MKNSQEFIGSQVEIADHTNKKLTGTIIDETKNTFKIKTEKKIKTILKKNKKFIIKQEQINGNQIIKRPEERIKK